MSLSTEVLESMADEPTEIGVWVREKVLGSGGFGVVTLWRNTEQGNLIAVKKCRWGTDSLLTPKHKERWTNEVEIMQRLSHRGVVRALPVPPEFERELRGELPLLCMEYCAHGDLRQVLNRAENCCGIREPEIRALLKDVTHAVEFLHANKITHRDLKPENIVMQDDANGKITYKLIDLGYAKELDASSMCASFVGTLQYLAPELFLSKKYSCTVDYWSLGLVAHEIITGVRPFLPSMTPVAWMTHVQRKAPDDICAYQREDGSIVFSKQLFPQNHISSSLQYHMEKWLRLLLDWDPKRRGRCSHDSELLVFSMLNSIFEKKVVPIFCVTTSQCLSYEVDNSTGLSTLQQQIARDTKIPVSEQELLFPRGTVPDPNQLAFQCCMPDDGTEWCVYVLRKGELILPEVKPDVPQLVTQMIADAKTPVAYVFQKRAWAHAIFFLQQEAKLYCNFLRAHRAKLLHVLSYTCELGRQVQQLNQERHKTAAHQEFFSISLATDNAKALEVSKPQVQVLAKAWIKESENLSKKFTELNEKCGQLEAQAEAVGAQALQLQRSPFARVRISSNLDNLVEAGQQCYEALRRRTKEQRQKPQSHADMARVVYNCLKHRDKLLHDEPFNDHLKQLINCQSATNEVLEPLNVALNELTTLRSELSHLQAKRQNDIWTLLGKEVEKEPPEIPIRGSSMMGASSTDTPTKTPSVPQSPTVVTKESKPQQGEAASLPPTTNIVASQVPTQCFAQQLQSLPSQPVESSSVVQENIRLRHMTQELMNRSFNVYKNLISLDPAHLTEE